MFTLLVALSTDANADWYSDGKAVIEQLIEDDLSTTVIPNAAAKVPALCIYFPGSMGAIQDKRYTGLDSVLRKELADLLGYEVYETITQSPGTAAGIGSGATAGNGSGSAGVVRDSIPASAAAKSEFSKYQASRTKLTEEEFNEAQKVVTNNIRRRDHLAEPRTRSGSGSGSQEPVSTSCEGSGAGSAQFNNQTSVATLQMNTCEQVQADKTQEVGCAAGIVVRDAFDGSQSALPDDLKRLAAALKAIVAGTSTEFQALVDLVNGRSVVTVDATLALAAALGKACEGNATCDALATWASPSDAVSDLIAVITDLKKHDYGAAARTLVTSAIALACNGSKVGICSTDSQLVTTFVANLAVYIIDSVSSGQSAESAEDDFRQSAVDLIEAYGAGLGYSRKWDSTKAILYPHGSLRAAYRPGHATPDQSTAQTYASIDFPSLRYPIVYTEYMFFAVQGSVFDVLGGPFEAATTGHLLDGDPHRTKAIVEAFFVPRLELELGSPALARNVVVGVGVAFRLYDSRFDTPDAAHYCFAGDCPLGWNNFEFGVSVTYIP